jgi:hypothetical protein
LILGKTTSEVDATREMLAAAYGRRGAD